MTHTLAHFFKQLAQAVGRTFHLDKEYESPIDQIQAALRRLDPMERTQAATLIYQLSQDAPPAAPAADWEVFQFDTKDRSSYVRRLEVPGGWLYQVAEVAAGWSPPTFVPGDRR